MEDQERSSWAMSVSKIAAVSLNLIEATALVEDRRCWR